MFSKVHHSTEKRKENIKRVKDWLENNPDGRKGDCCKDLGISYPTLQKITKDIQEGK